MYYQRKTYESVELHLEKCLKYQEVCVCVFVPMNVKTLLYGER